MAANVPSREGASSMNVGMGTGRFGVDGIDVGQSFANDLESRRFAAASATVQPSYNPNENYTRFTSNGGTEPPSYINQGGGSLPVAYNAPSHTKERLHLEAETLAAINNQMNMTSPGGKAHVIRTMPVTDTEMGYVKDMHDMSELAKFDEYVESYINPRIPGNMKFLMEVYPQYVQRRLQQTQRDYEFALRKQMIDSWGISSFDDLHFLYLCDQKQIDGPTLQKRKENLNDRYTPGFLSMYNSMGKRKDNKNILYGPYSSAQHGYRPGDNFEWGKFRDGPMSQGNTMREIAQGAFLGPTPTPSSAPPVPEAD